MTILLLSAGTRNKIVQYFRSVEGVRVVATDMQKTAPAIYEADAFYIVPRITDPGYLDIICDICRKEKVDAVLSLIDPELGLLAANEDRFRQLGVTVVGSNKELCERALDKMQMYRWLVSHEYPCAKSYVDKKAFYLDLQNDKISYPVFIKPIRGSASIGISVVENSSMLDFLFSHFNGMMVQEYLKGQEIGADVYIDMVSHEVVLIFTKKKLLMRSGETDKSVSFKDERLFELIERFCKESGWLGQIDIDLFEIDGKYFISEVNPRFGGGYPHAYECGCNHMKMIVNNLRGIPNRRAIGAYDEGIYMMKYNEIRVDKL